MAVWVFGYGSLLWNPGFTPVESRPAVLDGYHRSFCMLSIHHRGSEEEPGLVLALDRDARARCSGLALRIDEAEEAEVLKMIRERELISSAYDEREVSLRTEDGGRLKALAYVVNRAHRQYCDYDLERQARIIATATGGRGPNSEYLFATQAMFRDLGIKDRDIAWLDRRVRELRRGA